MYDLNFELPLANQEKNVQNKYTVAKKKKFHTTLKIFFQMMF